MGPLHCRLGRVLLVLCTICAAALVPAEAQLPTDSTLQRIVRERVESGRSAGIVLGMMSSEGATTIVSWGRPEAGHPLDATTQFEIGSITKVFTGTVLAEMVRAGEVRLEDTLAQHLPHTKVPERGGRQMRLIDLATHHSGLPNMPENFHPADPTNPYADYSLEQMYAALSETSSGRDIGARYEYSNFGTALLGQALANRAQRPYDDLLRERILEPLGMGDTGVSLTPAMRSRLAPGHDASGNRVPNWDLGAFAPAGGLRSNMIDMLAFLEANLKPTQSTLGKAISDSHVTRAVISPEAGVSLNWHTYVEDGDTVVYHPGETGGYRAFVGFVPTKKVGVVILIKLTDEHRRHRISPVAG
jgi:serine-type D-Ala-D-Ala carboxypeptidase/endopeptidase